ncbi:MAG: hypothetical protein FD155_351 [Bacteroidetes bacterium]|nr:MAG: hypothetical protein FD155_351 [Bacteroidota bacterium]
MFLHCYYAFFEMTFSSSKIIPFFHQIEFNWRLIGKLGRGSCKTILMLLQSKPISQTGCKSIVGV